MKNSLLFEVNNEFEGNYTTKEYRQELKEEMNARHVDFFCFAPKEEKISMYTTVGRKTVFLKAVEHSQKHHRNKPMYAYNYSMLFTEALYYGEEHFLASIIKSFKQLKCEMPRYKHYLKIEIVCAERKSLSDSIITAESIDIIDEERLELLIEREKNAFRIVFNGLQEYYYVINVKYQNNENFYNIYERPAISQFQDMMNEYIVNLFDYVNRDSCNIKRIFEGLIKINNGVENREEIILEKGSIIL